MESLLAIGAGRAAGRDGVPSGFTRVLPASVRVRAQFLGVVWVWVITAHRRVVK